MQRNKKVWLIHRKKKKKKLTESLPEEEQTLNLLDKDFKSTLKYVQKYKRNHGQKRTNLTNHILFPSNLWPYVYVLSRSYMCNLKLYKKIFKPQNDLSLFIEER